MIRLDAKITHSTTLLGQHDQMIMTLSNLPQPILFDVEFGDLFDNLKEECMACNIAKFILNQSQVLPTTSDIDITCKFRKDINITRTYGLHFEFTLDTNKGQIQWEGGTIVAKSKRYEHSPFSANSFKLIMDPACVYRHRLRVPTILVVSQMKMNPKIPPFKEIQDTFVFKKDIEKSDELHIEIEDHLFTNLIKISV